MHFNKAHNAKVEAKRLYGPAMTTSAIAPTAHETSRPAPTRSKAFIVFDLVGLAWGALSVLFSLAVVLRVAPHFATIFREPGNGSLPWLTRLCLTPWFPLIVGAIPLLVMGAGMLTKVPIAARALLVGIGAFFAVAQVVVFIVAMYLPIFSVAAGIQ